MEYFKNKKELAIKAAVVILVSVILISLPDLRKSTDKLIENILVNTRGEILPDTNIILIHFSEEDIARIGPWPIRRNYYALLVKELTDLHVKKIGIEIFLSSRLVTQSIYDNLLTKEIEKSGIAVLSSVAGGIEQRNGIFYTDSLSYPSPKLINENLPTGHINFMKDYDYEIPLILLNDSIKEKAFSVQVSGLASDKKSITINFISSWTKFKNYSVLEFTNLKYLHSAELNSFKNKTVLIGVSDTQIAPAIQTVFDDEMPGFAFHAFAIDNLLNSRDYKTGFYLLSLFVFPLLILLFVIIIDHHPQKILAKYIFTGIVLAAILFVLITLTFTKISSSLLLLTFLSAAITEAAIFFLQGQKELKGVLDEAALLKNLLSLKEKELGIFQKQLSESGQQSQKLIARIESLKSDIEKLKGNEDDRMAAEITSGSKMENFHGIIYSSTIVARVIDLIKKAAPTDTTVLITGESGTGKELAARAIHLLSKRKDKNFVAVNCGALTENLLESELFGHMRGSFTGAIADKQGRFEMADEGTIFLDEIGETSENFQAKLLRVLQSGEIEKIGSTKEQRVNVRVIAATNKSLSELVKAKKFREDLFYRLNVINIELPPLRERKEDINILAAYFLKQEADEMSISKAVVQAFNDYNWNGNVRELESVIKRAVIFAKSEGRKLIHLSDIPGEIVREATYSFDEIVLESLRTKKFSHSSITETAKELGNLNRTIIAENLRGIALKVLVESGFDMEKTVLVISGNDEEETCKRVEAKIQTFLKNIENDLSKTKIEDFEAIKNKFSSKYKNLPVKFHNYLDEVIRKMMKESFQ